jgi:type IV secretion system protein VirB8
MKTRVVKRCQQVLERLFGKSFTPDTHESEHATSANGRYKQHRENSEYFQLASSWADDYYTIVSASRHRYKMAFFGVMGLCALLSMSVLALSKTHEYIPLLVHHYASGAVSVEQATKQYQPDNKAEVESELVRYIVNRESYDPASFAQQYQLVSLMSASEVVHVYHQAQMNNSEQSYIERFGNKVIRSVKVESVNFLDSPHFNDEENHDTGHKNLAEVNFIVTDRNVKSGIESKTPFVAILQWTHTGIPNDPEARWLNWNGFIITHYQRNQRTL